MRATLSGPSPPPLPTRGNAPIPFSNPNVFHKTKHIDTSPCRTAEMETDSETGSCNRWRVHTRKSGGVRFVSLPLVSALFPPLLFFPNPRLRRAVPGDEAIITLIYLCVAVVLLSAGTTFEGCVRITTVVRGNHNVPEEVGPLLPP